MTKTAETVWNKCLSFLKDNVSDQAYKTWFDPVSAVKLEESVLSIAVPSKFFYEWLEDNYVDVIKSAIVKELGDNARLIYVIRMENGGNANNPHTESIPSTHKPSGKFNNNYNDASKGKPTEIRNPFVIPGIQKLKIASQLRLDYTFDNFIEGSCNRVARASGESVANKPGSSSFNPLFMFGASGLGKTHLAHAIGVQTKEKHPDKIVLYVSTDRFIQQYGESVTKNTRNDFVHFYQSIDVLIVDDIQFLSGKKGTQDIFFQIFNHLHQNGKQVVIFSDKSPVNMQDIEQRLLSRFKWGVSAELSRPDDQTRFNIIKHKTLADGIQISDEVIDYIAQYGKSNIRDLHGIVMSLMAHSAFDKVEIGLPLVKSILQNYVKKSTKSITVELIQKIVSDYFKMDMERLQSTTRKREVVQARQLAMYFSDMYTDDSLASIGTKIGKKNHATVLHARKTINNLLETDAIFRKYIHDIKQKIKSY